MHIEYEISHWVRENDHVRKLLSLWSDKEKENATLGKLQNFFEKIDRYDVLDDTFDLFGTFKNKKMKNTSSDVNVYIFNFFNF